MRIDINNINDRENTYFINCIRNFIGAKCGCIGYDQWTIPNGQEIVKFCRSLRRIPEAKNTKLIVLSERISGDRMQELLSLGVQAVIDKPYTIDDLRPHLLRTLGYSTLSSA